MKNTIFASIVLCLIALMTFSVSATAKPTDIETEIASLATENEKIVRAACIVYKRDCLVCVQTQNMTLRTEYNEYVNSLAKTIKNKYEIDNVYVCADPKIMRLIDKLQQLEEDDRQDIIRRLIDAEKQRHSTGLLPLPTMAEFFR